MLRRHSPDSADGNGALYRTVPKDLGVVAGSTLKDGAKAGEGARDDERLLPPLDASCLLPLRPDATPVTRPPKSPVDFAPQRQQVAQSEAFSGRLVLGRAVTVRDM